MNRRLSFVANKVARRILVSFVLAALIPVGILGLLSYRQVAEQLRLHTAGALRADCKGYAMQLLARLDLAKSELRLHAHHIRRSEHAFRFSDEGDVDKRQLQEHFKSLVVMGPDGQRFPLLGGADGVPGLSPEEFRDIISGRIYLRPAAGSVSGARPLWMGLGLDGQSSDSAVLLAQLQPELLWQLETGLPDHICVIDAAGQVLLASDCALPADVRGRVLRANSGAISWAEAGSDYVGAFWRIPIKTLYAGPDIIVVLAQTAEVAYMPMAHFSELYPPVIAFAVVIILILSTRLIAKYLTPLERLKVATQRLAGGDFGCRVLIESGDEFQALGESFNDMARRLQGHFDMLSTMAEIDRNILSALNADDIVETALSRLPGILSCDLISIARFDPATGHVLDIRTQGGGPGTMAGATALAREDVLGLIASGTQRIDAGDQRPPFLQALGLSADWRFLIVPVLVQGSLVSSVSLGYKIPRDIPADVPAMARSMGDRIAVALSNAAWEEKLYRQAHYDHLTGLPNRLVLMDRVVQEMARAKGNDTQFGVLFIDLDRFKNINDSLGHAAGDELILQVAGILRACVRETDVVVRIGGDEFAITVTDLDMDESVVATVCSIAEKIMSSLKQTLIVAGQPITCTASLGIAMYPGDAETVGDLLKNADAALYHAKSEGRANFKFYSRELNAAALENIALEHELRGAIAKGELEVFYQPKIDLNGRIVGAEALVRWRHREKGMISPAKFIPLAEQSGLIVDIGDWVLWQTCRWVADCQAKGLPAFRVSVNLSALEFKRSELVGRVAEILADTAVDPCLIELELTESVAIFDSRTCISRMNDLKRMGVTLAMDDFGTGFSSLSYLKDLPLDVLKIDQSFVRQLESNVSSQAIIRAILSLAQGLGLEVVAEGVENETQLNFLKQYECGIFQGFLFSRPIPAEEFVQLLETDPFRKSASNESTLLLRSGL